MQPIAETDLILNADGSVYHLNLVPGDVADTVITVGDPDRVMEVSKHFDSIELKKGRREFITHTGTLAGNRLTVLSTGIGTDNIDIVLNELDALVNIDFNTRLIKTQLHRLNIIRIGTSGAIQPHVPVDTLMVSSAAIGLDALMHYYQTAINAPNEILLNAFKTALPAGVAIEPYFATADASLLSRLGSGLPHGLTITAPGFYAPQGRQVRGQAATESLMKTLQNFEHKGRRITNLEMETAGIYGLGLVLGHRALSFNIILANRATNTFSKNPAAIPEKYIKLVLERLIDL